MKRNSFISIVYKLLYGGSFLFLLSVAECPSLNDQNQATNENSGSSLEDTGIASDEDAVADSDPQSLVEEDDVVSNDEDVADEEDSEENKTETSNQTVASSASAVTSSTSTSSTTTTSSSTTNTSSTPAPPQVPKVTIEGVDLDLVSTEGQGITSTLVSWNSDLKGTFKTMIGSTSCSDAYLLASNSNGLYASGSVNANTTVAAQILASDLVQGSNTIRVCFVADNGKTASSSLVTITRDDSDATITIASNTYDYMTTNSGGYASSALSWSASKAGSYKIMINANCPSSATAANSDGANASGSVAAGTSVASTILANDNNIQVGTNTIRICFIASANNNASETTKTIIIDNTAPTVSISTTNTPITIGAEDNLVTSLTAASFNFTEAVGMESGFCASGKYSVSGTDGSTTLSVNSATANSLACDFTLSGNFGTTGTVTLTTSAKDKAGNAVASASKSVVIYKGTIASSNLSSGNDILTDIIMDSTYMYLGGYSDSGANDQKWHYERRNRNTLALIAGSSNGGWQEGIIDSNPVTGITLDADVMRAIGVDSNYLYGAGAQNKSPNVKWRVEKRDLSTGQLVNGFGDTDMSDGDADTADGVFTGLATLGIWDFALDSTTLYLLGKNNYGTNGGQAMRMYYLDINDGTTGSFKMVVQSLTGATGDLGNAILFDSAGTNYYVAGKWENTEAHWLISKRAISTGAAVGAFDGDTAYNSGGYPYNGLIHYNIYDNGGSANEQALNIEQDTSSLYIIGYDTNTSSGDRQWRIEKRNKTTGALDSSFGGYALSSAGSTSISVSTQDHLGSTIPGGVATINFSSNDEQPGDIVLLGSSIYIAGYERSLGSADARWVLVKLKTSNDAAVTSVGTLGNSFDQSFGGYLINSSGSVDNTFTDGIIIKDFSSGDDSSNEIELLDSKWIIWGGREYSTGGGQWRIEKVRITDGITGLE